MSQNTIQPVDQALKRITKMEKFLANLNMIIQRMTQKMQAIESDNTKNTLRYNSFRQDMKKSIGDQVDIRTANFKDDFISIDELRGVKIAIKELQMKVKSKVDLSVYHDEMTKKESEHVEESEKIGANFEKIKKELQSMVQYNKKSEQITNKVIDQLKHQTQNTIKMLENENTQKHQQLNEKISNLQQTSDQIKKSLTDLTTSFQANRDAVYSQLNQKKQSQSSKFLDLQRKIADYDKRIRQDIIDRIDLVKAATDALSIRQQSNSDKILKQMSNIRIRAVTNQNKILALTEQLQQKFDTSSGLLEGTKDQLHTQQVIINQQIQKLRQAIEQLKKQQSKVEVKKEAPSPSPKLERKASRNASNPKAESRMQIDQPQAQMEQSATKSRLRNRMENALMNSTNLKQSYEHQQKDSVNLIEAPTHQPLRALQTPTQDLQSILGQSQITNQMQQTINSLKIKVGDVEASVTILRQMIDSKVNQSEIIKLQDNKCNKHSFKELVIKLELLKTFLQKQLPQCQGLKTIIFDESGVSMSTIARFAALRTRQQHRQRDESSKEKSRQKEKQAEKKASQPRFPLMVNHSRKRYLTILDRTQYLHESSVKYFQS